MYDYILTSLININQDSYFNTHNWVAELKETNPFIMICLLGNKEDMNHQRQVSYHVLEREKYELR